MKKDTDAAPAINLEAEIRRLGLSAALCADAKTIAAVMERYCRELELFNAAYDLVGASTCEEIYRRHILDSLAGAPVLADFFERLSREKNGAPLRVADVGSGAGLPGIPLAAAFPSVQFTLVERMSKRCDFLENCRVVLGLKNMDVLQSEAEKAPRAAFDAVVFRAFRPLDANILRTLLALLAPGGFLAAYKAKSEKIRAEMAALAVLAPRWKQIALDAGFLGAGEAERERNLVVLYGSDVVI